MHNNARLSGWHGRPTAFQEENCCWPGNLSAAFTQFSSSQEACSRWEGEKLVDSCWLFPDLQTCIQGQLQCLPDWTPVAVLLQQVRYCWIDVRVPRLMHISLAQGQECYQHQWLSLRESMLCERFCTICTDRGENWHSRRRSCEGSLVQRVSVSVELCSPESGRARRPGSLTRAAKVSLSEFKVARGGGWDFTRPVSEFRRLLSFLGDLECSLHMSIISEVLVL